MRNIAVVFHPTFFPYNIFLLAIIYDCFLLILELL